MRRLVVAVVAVLLAAGASPVSAAKPARERPVGPAKVRFARDFPRLVDSEWKFPIGGIGGIRRNAPRKHIPVIFVHGNVTDHGDWYPVRDDFRAAGWTDQEIWALSYNGTESHGNGNALTRQNPEAQAERLAMGSDGRSRITENDINVPDLYAFIKAVRAYTGSPRFSLVTHSLGVTVARKTLKVHPELRRDLVAFVGIAGGNHGTSFCPPGSEGNVVSCDEIAAGTPWLAALNGPAGKDETYGPTRWLTISDGSGIADPGFAATYKDSPLLRGADNRTYPGTYHNDLRLVPEIVKTYRLFLEDAERRAARTAS